MGEIFLAKHGLAGFEKLAVIKKVLPHLAEDAQFISRFVDEAQVAIKLAHVNVAQVFEVGRVGDEYFLALEYVDGRDLRRTLSLLAHEKRRFPLDIALLIGRELANGLAYAHRRTAADGSSLGLVHCDISPPNVMVSFEGETKIIDFGIARSALRGTATDPKMGFGKFGYMAPEQLLRGGIVDHRTDVYAAGVVLFELLTGCRLYEPKDFTDYRALARAVAQGQHRVPSDLDPALASCDTLITTALAPRPEDRYSTAADLRDSIQRLLAVVNPTVSTDQLSAVMRGLFATEMAQQRELQERIANTHLSDFHEQLNTQVVPTVSFALSEPSADLVPQRVESAQKRVEGGPKRAEGGPKRVEGGPKRVEGGPKRVEGGPKRVEGGPKRAEGGGGKRAELPGKQAAKRPAGEAAPKRSAEPGARRVEPVAGPSKEPSVVDRPARPAVATASSVSAPPGQGAPPRVAVDEIAARMHSIDVRSRRLTLIAVSVAMAVVVGAVVFVLIRSHLNQVPAAKIVPVVQPIEEDPAPAPEGALTRDGVVGQFEAVTKEYSAFKAHHGTRLEVEWRDLSTFMQSQVRSDNLQEAMRKIEGFRAQMRSAPHK